MADKPPRQVERELLKRIAAAELRAAVPPKPEPERVTLDRLVALVETDYAVNQRKSRPRVRQAAKRLTEFFGPDASADQLARYDRVNAYIERRLEQGAARATVRNEVGLLGRMFTLAYRNGLVPARPPLPPIQVRNTRTGFFEERDLRAILVHLPEYMRGLVLFAYYTGWRRGEVTGLRWSDVDARRGTVRLEPGTTKNDEGREFPYASHEPLAELLTDQRRAVAELERQTGREVPWVFPGPDGHRLAWY